MLCYSQNWQTALEIAIILAGRTHTDQSTFETDNPTGTGGYGLFKGGSGEKITDPKYAVEKAAFGEDGIVLKKGKKNFKKICVK